MSAELRNKLLSHEAMPPEVVWHNITPELDDSAIGSGFANTLKNAEFPPPSTAWNHITTSLDKHFFSADITEQLYLMEATPPAAAWTAISRTLDSEKEAAIPEHRRFAPFIRYAAAAAVAGIMIWAGTSLFSGKEKNKGATASTAAEPEKADSNQSTPSTAGKQVLDDINTAIEEARNNAALEESKGVYASVDVAAVQKKAKDRNFNFPNNPDVINTGVRGLPEMDGDIYYEPPIDAENYVVLMTPDGKFVRMSKKLGDFVCCIAGEEQDKNCTDEMSRLREKMVNRPMAHSPGNFMDLVNLVSSMDEN